MRKNHPAVFGILMIALLMAFFLAKNGFMDGSGSSALALIPAPMPRNVAQHNEDPSDVDLTGGASRSPGTEPTFFGKTASDLMMQAATPVLMLDNNVLVFHCRADELISGVWRWNSTHPDLPIVQVLSFDTRPDRVSSRVHYLAITFERTPLRERRG